jgi:DNA-binding NarL/FixJ family response regulator
MPRLTRKATQGEVTVCQNRDAMKTTVLIAEDDALLRELLAETLACQQDLEVVGRASDGRAALAETARLCPQVLLLDLNLPEISGLEVLEALLTAEYQPRVLILSGEEGDPVQLAAARTGARGFLPKARALSVLPDTIRAVAAGELCFSRRIISGIVNDYVLLSQRVEQEERPASRLSERERDVLRAVAQGLTNQQIGRELFMSVSTVKVHLRSVLRKLNLPNRTEAVIFAVREGLTDAGGSPRPAIRSPRSVVPG